jgi:hypothetical protein
LAGRRNQRVGACARAQELLAASVAGWLSAEERESLSQHVLECEECARERTSLERLWQSGAYSPDPVPEGPSIIWSDKPRAVLQARGLAAALAVGLVGLMLLIVHVTRVRQTPAPRQTAQQAGGGSAPAVPSLAPRVSFPPRPTPVVAAHKPSRAVKMARAQRPVQTRGRVHTARSVIAPKPADAVLRPATGRGPAAMVAAEPSVVPSAAPPATTEIGEGSGAARMAIASALPSDADRDRIGRGRALEKHEFTDVPQAEVVGYLGSLALVCVPPSDGVPLRLVAPGGEAVEQTMPRGKGERA